MSENFLKADKKPHLVYLVDGSDAGLLSQEIVTLMSALNGIDNATVAAVEEYGSKSDDGYSIGSALDACRTPPFFEDRRIVVIRDVHAMDAPQVKELVAYINEPMDTTVLVLGHYSRKADGGTKAPPAALSKAVKASGLFISAVPAATGRARTEWFSERISDSPVHLDRGAADVLQKHLGEDLNRLEGMLAQLEAAFDKGTTIRVDDLEPFLGSAGSVAPWDLTDAIDKGDGDGAIAALDRMMNAGERHALQILATLHKHFGAMLRLDGSGITDEQSASAATKMAPYPAKKAMAQSRRLGHDRIAQAIALLAKADIDVRGGIGWPPEFVMEVLVARLAQLGRVSAAPARPAYSRS